MEKFKKCKSCGSELPLNSDNYRKTKQCKDGYENVCKTCTSLKAKQWREKNKEHIKEYAKQYSLENEKKIKENKKEYDKLNKERKKEWSKQWWLKNSESAKIKSIEWKSKNKERISEYNKKWRKEHPESDVVRRQKRQSLKKNLPSTLTLDQWNCIKEHFDNKCSYCGKQLPLAQEHFVPLSKGGEYTHNNIIPACQSCNSSKNNKDFFEWYPKQKYYSKKREKKILDFLNYKNGVQQLKLAIGD